MLTACHARIPVPIKISHLYISWQILVDSQVVTLRGLSMYKSFQKKSVNIFLALKGGVIP
jgi:hypothetical protein